MSTDTNSSGLIYVAMKALEIKTCMLFNLVFAKNTILSCFFLFFLIIDLYFLIPAVTVQFSNSTAKFVISTGTSNRKAKAEQSHPVTAKAKTS